MNDSERFFHLSNVYKGLAETAYENLSALKAQQNKGILAKIFVKSPLDKMKPFSLGPARSGLTNTKDNKSYTFILGEFNEQMAFYPSITEKILKIHSVSNMVNAILKTKKTPSEQALVQPLQEALLDFYFLEKTFAYYAHRAALVERKLDNMVQENAELDNLFKSYYDWFVNGLNDLFKPCLDVAHLNMKLKQYVFRSYSWMTYEVGEDGRVVNDYFLPKEYWEPFLNHMTTEQAKAMARQQA
ncbi:MAG: hypothetical protein LUQ11_05180 [Methylococcaceae bacterium]|nr:hypothetical protein [Methylococcaceae bacterium]